MATDHRRNKKNYSFFKQRPINAPVGANGAVVDVTSMKRTYGSSRYGGAFIPVSMGPPPTLISLDFDLADSLGGDSITATGSNLHDAISCTVGGSPVLVSGNTESSISFSMPALPTGLYNVQVETAGGLSNTLEIRAWTPSDATSAICLHRFRPDQGLTIGTPPGIEVINDLIGVMHQRQSTAVSQPEFVAADSAYNGKPVISNSSGAKVFVADAAAAAIVVPVTLYVVGQLTSATRSLIAADNSTPGNMLWRSGNSTSFFSGPVTQSSLTGPSDSLIASPSIIVVTDDGGGSASALKLYVNDLTTPKASGVHSTAQGWGSTTKMTLCAPAPATGVNVMIGKCAEVAIFNGVLDATDLLYLQKYNLIRYGIEP